MTEKDLEIQELRRENDELRKEVGLLRGIVDIQDERIAKLKGVIKQAADELTLILGASR